MKHYTIAAIPFDGGHVYLAHPLSSPPQGALTVAKRKNLEYDTVLRHFVMEGNSLPSAITLRYDPQMSLQTLKDAILGHLSLPRHSDSDDYWSPASKLHGPFTSKEAAEALMEEIS